MKNKTAEQFKLAWPWSRPPGLWGGLDRKTQQRAVSSVQNAILPAAAVAIPTALLSAAGHSMSDDTADTLKNVALASGGMLAMHAAHGMLMGDKKTPIAQAYQRGIGSDIRHIANQGRKQMGMNQIKMPRPPAAKVASVAQFKLAYGDPYGRMPPGAEYYGQYGHDNRDDGSSALNTALMLGGGAALAGGLHHTLMNTRGKLMGGGLVNAYQKGVGGSIRGAANDLRQGMGVDPVAMPPHPVVGHAQDLAKLLYDNKKKILGGLGTAAVLGTKAVEGHKNLMGADTNAGQMYRGVAEPVMAGAGKVVEKGKQVAGQVGGAAKKVVEKGRKAVEWAKGSPGEPSAPEPSVSPGVEGKLRSSEPKPPMSLKQKAQTIEASIGGKGGKAPRKEPAEVKARAQPQVRVKKSSMIYQAGADDALATYFR